MNYQYSQPNGLYGANNVIYGGNGINWVQGESGAKSYLVAPGNTVLLMDAESRKFYLKSADTMGVPSMRVFEYTESSQTRSDVPIPTEKNADVQFATRDEMDEIRSKLEAMEKRITDSKKGGKADE